MNQRKPPEADSELLDRMTELFNELEIESLDEAKQILRSAGYDPTVIATEFQQKASRALAKSPLNWRNRAQHEIEQERTRLQSMTKPDISVRAKLQEAVSELMARVQQIHGRQAVAHFRNLAEVTDEDLADIAVELEYLLSKKD
jgi:hypothetical protein